MNAILHFYLFVSHFFQMYSVQMRITCNKGTPLGVNMHPAYYEISPFFIEFYISWTVAWLQWL